MSLRQTALADGDWDTISVVIRSQYRVGTLRVLNDRPHVPSAIAEETGVAIAHVSRSLSTLRDEQLVELLVPEYVRKGRVYGITEAGERILAQIDTGDLARRCG